MTAVEHAAPTSGRPRFGLGRLLAGLWLIFLIDPLARGWSLWLAGRGPLGVLSTLAFGAAFLTLWIRTQADRRRRLGGPPIAVSVGLVLALAALGASMAALLGQSGLASAVYLAAAVVMVFPLRVAAAVVLTLVVISFVLGAAAGWGAQTDIAFSIVATALAVLGLRTTMRRNVELMAAAEENARLAVDNERSRFARDLHDILGHSLTVITVKAELALRLIDVDPLRTRTEIADLERLSRDALHDVRRAVRGYREMTLPGELARARAALESADIVAALPNSTDEVLSELRDLFAWTVREGVTNVIRHSGARSCTVRLTPTSAEVYDDGPGGSPTVPGSGLVGLQERAEASGARMTVRRLANGHSLMVVVR